VSNQAEVTFDEDIVRLFVAIFSPELKVFGFVLFG